MKAPALEESSFFRGVLCRTSSIVGAGGINWLIAPISGRGSIPNRRGIAQVIVCFGAASSSITVHVGSSGGR